jgi:aminoglycoside phosphotransferase (APT) family kinase protein
MSEGLLSDPAALSRLTHFLMGATGASSVSIVKAEPLRGGAIQENWALDIDISDGPHRSRQALVLRTDARSRVAVSHGRAQEFALLKAASAAGVTVPEPLWLCTDPTVLGRDFYLMRRLPGTAAGHRIVRDTTLGGPREALAERLGQELARIHAITPASIGALAPGFSFDFLALPKASYAIDSVQRYRGHLDELDIARPALEWGLRWLELNAPPPGEVTLVHQDFRTGNYLIDERGLVAILDWEFCAWGNPLSDVGWFCARCWRFGAADQEAGGIASREPFYHGYEAASGRTVDRRAVHYWEAMAHVRWAVIALQQAARHLSGAEPSLELALTGRILPELELEILNLVDAADAVAA